MTRTENEQEFVLGNKQLLSAFFVVVMLLGVFFAMGYIIGHNSTVEGAAKKAAQAEPAPAAATPAAGATAEPVQSSTPEPLPPQSAAPPERAPVQTAPAQAEQAPVRTSAVEKAPVKAAVEESEGTRRVQSSPGHIYLQVSAVKRPAADSIVKTLKDKGFPALLGESSKPELFRVLVGPYSETEALSKAKSDLKAIGFDAVVSK